MSQALKLKALDLLKTGEFRPGTAMEKAHQICQDHEGVPHFDWIHALIHRIEGDDANAGYWYRRAGQNRNPGAIEDEWRAIRAAIENA